MRRIAALLATLAIAVGATPGPALAGGPGGHGHAHAGEAEAAGLAPAPAGLQRSLEDETRPSGPGRIAWSTYWKLCWQAVAGARYYELRMQTSEGAPRTPTRLDATCHRVEVAAGENPASDGLPQRELMLAMQAAQAALQVRAVLADGSHTAWTGEQPVGATSAAVP